MDEEQWDEVKKGSLIPLEPAVFTSSTLRRCQLLHQLQDTIARDSQLPPQLYKKVLLLLFRTYPVYIDRESRHAAQSCAKALFPSIPCTDLPAFAQLLRKESSNAAVAPANAFVLVEWCSTLLQYLSTRLDDYSQLVLETVSAIGKALETCLGTSTRQSLKHSAIIITRRALRAVFSADSHGSNLVRDVVPSLIKEAASGFKNAPILGVICGVCARLPNRKNDLDAVKGDIFQFYSKEIVASRTPVPRHVHEGIRDLFTSFSTTEDLQKYVWPAVEKAILRSPEILLAGVLTSLVSSIPVEIDLSEVFSSSICKQLLANIKSTNAVIRKGAIEALEAFIPRCSDEKSLLKVVDEVVTPLKAQKIPNVEQRALQAQVLRVVPCSSSASQAILTGLSAALLRESSEVALEPEIKSFCHHLTFLVSSRTDASKKNCTTVIKGCDDKRAGFRKTWLVNMGELFWNCDNSALQSAQTFSKECLHPVLTRLHKSFTEISANPIPSLQGGTISIANILTALSFEKFWNEDNLPYPIKDIFPTALSVSPKPSFLLNPKIYTKLSSADELEWVLRALFAVTVQPGFATSDEQVREAWAQSFIYLVCSLASPPKIRQLASCLLRQCYLKQPILIGTTIISSIWKWLYYLDIADKEAAAVLSGAEKSNLSHVVRAITPSVSERDGHDSINKKDLESQCIELLVLCRPELVPGTSWINVSLKMGVDPGKLAIEYPDQCLNQILLSTGDPIRNNIAEAQQAAWNAAADLGFVAPEVMIPKLVAQFCEDLKPERISQFSATDIAIARHTGDTPFIDVLDTKAKNLPNKSAKDYDTLKWEEELRAEVAKKHGQKQKKLTADEQAKVKAQLEKESGIRDTVHSAEVMIRRGAGIIKSLANSPPTEADGWINPACSSLCKLAQLGGGVIVGDSISSALMACGNKVSSRIGEMRPFVAIATLRAVGKTFLRSELETEPLGSLITRILYRLRILSEQRPLDGVSLGYILPLIFIVLENNGIEESKDDSGEQVLLALEFISFHTNSFTDARLPRIETLGHLINAMRKHTAHYKLVRDALSDLCRAMAANIQPDELEVLLRGSMSREIPVRTAVLQSILSEIDLTDIDFSVYIWIAYHDNVAENAEIAREIWEENALDVDEQSPDLIINHLANDDLSLRSAAALALAHACELCPSIFSDTLKKLESMYREQVHTKPVQTDSYGMPRKAEQADAWEIRSGIALSFGAMASGFSGDDIVSFFRFLIDEGPLIDRNASVRRQMAESGSAVITSRGREKVEELMSIFETTLETSDKETEQSDWLNEAVIILYGSLAQHLVAGDNRIQKVTRKLMDALSTPSETVQLAVAQCLIPLIRLDASDASHFVQELLDQLFTSKKYAARRGAAYGLAGLVRGKGILALRDFGIMSRLTEASENKKESNQRQGAVLAYELLAFVLGRVFEPYVIRIVPQLLTSFGDPSIDVRDACLDAAKACFASLSSFGVKQILPTLLDGLDDTQWRSKKGACDLLGAMAYLDPQQLALNLPDIIPPLTEVLNDSHKEVRNSANRSLQRFGDVISNPEVKSLVSILLKALSDPTKYTDEALDALIKISFVHYLDAPSLALVVRILERGLSDRSTTKRKAAQIIGSLAHLTERKDLISHLPILVAGLKTAVVDPVPTTRATASKALGSLIEKLGEDTLPDLIPSLMATLKSEAGAGDRMGSAQALAEVLAGLGTSRLEDTLPSLLQNVSSSKPTVREGFMTLFIFLPACFGNSFAAYLNRIIPPILVGLADEVESIRETSLRAGRLLVKNFSTRSIDLLLPELERGLANDNYRIRLSSVELIGDLLFNLTGATATEGEEEIDSAIQAGQSLLEVLGEERRNKVLSSLYICRCDTSGLVRSAAINVWKALVATPRTLKELVPTLSQVIIRRLGSSNMEQKVIAGNALGELIKKAGEGVLSTLLPELEEGLITSTDIDGRQGICLAVRELVVSSSDESLETYEKALISIVKTALVDTNDQVREAAAEAFDALQQALGKRIVDKVLPDLLHLLHNENDAEQALAALLTLLTEATRANIILPNLIPTLLTKPITGFNAKALASLSKVAGGGMNRRLPTILNTLMDEIISTEDSGLKSDVSEAFDTVLDSVDEFDGLNVAMNVMLALMKHDDHRRRSSAAMHLATFFSNTEMDISRFYPELIRVLLISFDDRDKKVVKAAWEGLNQLTKSMKKEEMEVLVNPARQVLRQVGVPGSNLAGFSLPKGIGAILPIFLQGLLNGNIEQRTQSALAIGDIIDRTSPESLKAFVTQITGPLIRVVSERSVDIKCAIFLALDKLLEKIPLFVKPFLPQLQRTFARGLADTSSETLRTRAAKGLGILITLTPRVDPLVAELITGSKTTDPGVKNAMLRALHDVVDKAGKNMSEASRQAVLGLVDNDSVDNAATMITNAKLAGALIKSLPTATAIPLIKNRILATQLTHQSILRLNAILVESPALLNENFHSEVPVAICHAIRNSDVFISDNGVLAAGKYLLSSHMDRKPEDEKEVFEALAGIVQPGKPVDTRRLTLVVLRTVARENQEMIARYRSLVVPPVFGGVRDTVIPVKLAAEAAFLAIFSVVESEGEVFEEYMKGPGAELPAGPKRSMQDYFKRVALRLGGQARERREAEGGQGGLGLSSDEVEDEKEVWSVGKVDLGESFGDD
ncbi:translational activator GCN1 [Trichophyton equinum CBS 127.97]|uniref:eIF-2-alpha kinase activator GCN1 n=1 Tax=Trichophyton equinum (strain ATCC MYA-4606 / CBS 127.97) TaxID=559882 RepID=F2PP35_TRIEC|nr:translational activator GCN1 [Trichophyton equinum CBS 127.97]